MAGQQGLERNPEAELSSENESIFLNGFRAKIGLQRGFLAGIGFLLKRMV